MTIEIRQHMAVPPAPEPELALVTEVLPGLAGWVRLNLLARNESRTARYSEQKPLPMGWWTFRD